MLQVERMSLILAELNANGRVTVNGLAERLMVSKVTIRRDLELLNQENKLLIVHGGAIKPNFRLYEAPFNQRHDINIDEKKQVGQKAAEFIQDYDVVAFGVGTTTLQIAKHLQNKHNLTIIVGCVSILNQLIERKKSGFFTGKIIFLGGEIDTDQMFATGTVMMDMLDRLNIDKAFIGANGYSIVNGITTYNIDEGNFLKRMILRSSEVYLVVDHTKIDAKSMYKYTEFNDVNHVICDSEPPSDWIKQLESEGVQWTKA
ncbi:DeoR/GlpR family DNA-binding transcription regulator [Paenibacillus spongiae]|uniref:DeoR/GlpR family DNA-binding transcription regulator n=1 Tax=Paenibacillus spongiae TaxID=2909671 RepID=A0ABY5SCA6_9BACL|nr:DeoR/GlpR family DNA-binding transcription regulator [Paenibacillus spongiae]UVI31289.1 DeoR/GlpR family DNA-binding transcription regulator [Paenibacillus spongiae]